MSVNLQRAMNRRNAIRLLGDQTTSLGLARGRLTAMRVGFGCLFLLVAIRTADLSIFQAVDHVPAKAQEITMQETPNAKPAKISNRGDIVDRNGVLLATTLKTASLFADTKHISDPQNAAKMLTHIFDDLSYADVLKNLESGKRFVWVKRGISPSQQEAVMHIGEPGLDFEYESTRFYPQGALLSHFMGMADVDGNGISGIEKQYHDRLASGETLALNMDSRIQHILRREIINAANEFDAVGGMGVVMNAKTGEVLAGVSYPDYAPDQMGDADSDQLFNRLTVGTYEFGSVFKVFSTAAFLEQYKVPLSTTFDASEPIKSGRHTIRDYHAEDRVLTIPEVFMYSSNIGSAMMGEAIGTDNMKKFYDDLGFLARINMDFGERGRPQVPKPWRDISTLTASYGHGIAVTPMHVAAAMAVMVNGGTWVTPSLVKSNSIADHTPDIAIISPETSQTMRQLLRLNVTDGTGKKANAKGFNIGGKTGTAEKPGKTRKGYDRKRLISSFVAAFPMDDPEYVVFIAIDEPKGNKKSYGYATAGWVAAPAISKTVQSMAAVLGLSPKYVTEDQEISHPLKQYVGTKK